MKQNHEISLKITTMDLMSMKLTDLSRLKLLHMKTILILENIKWDLQSAKASLPNYLETIPSLIINLHHFWTPNSTLNPLTIINLPIITINCFCWLQLTIITWTIFKQILNNNLTTSYQLAWMRLKSVFKSWKQLEINKSTWEYNCKENKFY